MRFTRHGLCPAGAAGAAMVSPGAARYGRFRRGCTATEGEIGMAKAIRIKRVYEAPEPADGARVLVDRIWPRGLRKTDAAVTLWLKEIAPSTALRKWFGHRPERWSGFKARYFDELRANPALENLSKTTGDGPTTLVYAAHDPVHNNAAALAEFLATNGGHRKSGED